MIDSIPSLTPKIENKPLTHCYQWVFGLFYEFKNVVIFLFFGLSNNFFHLFFGNDFSIC